MTSKLLQAIELQNAIAASDNSHVDRVSSFADFYPNQVIIHRDIKRY